MSKTKIKITIALIIVFLLIAYVIGDTLWIGMSRRTYNRIFGTKVDMDFIARRTEELLTSQNLQSVTNSQIIEWLIYNKDTDLVKIDDNGHNILDAWDMPIQIYYEEPMTYKLVSYGPNRKNDNGEGDDIVEIYDLSEDEIKKVEFSPQN